MKREIQQQILAENEKVGQGQLRRQGQPVTDRCDFQFLLFNAERGGAQIGATQFFDGQRATPEPVEVVAGRFVVELDFGPNAFNGDARWLAISLRCPSGAGAFTANPKAAGSAAETSTWPAAR